MKSKVIIIAILAHDLPFERLFAFRVVIKTMVHSAFLQFVLLQATWQS